MTYTEQFINSGQTPQFIPVASADTIQFPFHMGNNRYEIKSLMPSGYIIIPKGANATPGLMIPYLTSNGKEYLLYYVSNELTSEQFGDMRKLVTLRNKSPMGDMPIGPDNRVQLKNLDMSPDGDYYYSGRDFKGYGGEYLFLHEFGGLSYFFPQYLRK